jgi:hypothetical protein
LRGEPLVFQHLLHLFHQFGTGQAIFNGEVASQNPIEATQESYAILALKVQ